MALWFCVQKVSKMASENAKNQYKILSGCIGCDSFLVFLESSGFPRGTKKTKGFLWASFHDIWPWSKSSKFEIWKATSAKKIMIQKLFLCKNKHYIVVLLAPNFLLIFFTFMEILLKKHPIPEKSAPTPGCKREGGGADWVGWGADAVGTGFEGCWRGCGRALMRFMDPIDDGIAATLCGGADAIIVVGLEAAFKISKRSVKLSRTTKLRTSKGCFEL